MTIDAHHHFWKYDPEEYGWITDATPVLKRDYLPEDLQREVSAVGIDGVISVQARQSLRETDWLLELADHHPFIRGVVGWVPLTSPSVHADIERYSHRRKLRAVRHVLQDEADDGYMLRDDFNRGISALKDFDLRYDILIYERHLPNAIKLVDRHPNHVFVLDHIAKPRIRERIVSPWKENLRELARRPNVFCKLSGMVTEADQKIWTPQDLQPYMQAALEAFTPKRLMFGSDWPVCLLASSYKRWHDTVRNFATKLSAEEQSRLFGATALEAYGIGE